MIHFLILLMTVFSPVTSQAATPDCRDFPSILGAGGPTGAMTGFPFTFNLRLSCLLGDGYSLNALEGTYSNSLGNQLPTYIAISQSQLPDGNVLYQFIFDIPLLQADGSYLLNGCVRIRNMKTNATVCLPVSQSMEVRQ